MATCSYPECSKPGIARGLCSNHYRKARETNSLPPSRRVTSYSVDLFAACAKSGCERLGTHRGFCTTHYNQAKKAGTLPPPKTRPAMLCAIDGCEYPAFAAKICRHHYHHLKKFGDPLVGPTRRRIEPRICTVDGCEKHAVGHTPQLCRKHYYRFAKHGTTELVDRRNRGEGSNHDGYIRMFRDGRRVLQHRIVMEDALGRSLLPHEEIHHVNGERADNRLENLELWSKSQPPGQRVEDKIAFVIEMAKLYPQYLAAQGFRMMPLESAEATRALLGEPSFKDFDAAAVLRRWTNA